MKVVLGIALLALALSVGSLVWQAWPEGSEPLRKKQPALVEPYLERKRNQFNEDWRLRELEDKIDCVQQRAGSGESWNRPC